MKIKDKIWFQKSFLENPDGFRQREKHRFFDERPDAREQTDNDAEKGDFIICKNTNVLKLIIS